MQYNATVLCVAVACLSRIQIRSFGNDSPAAALTLTSVMYRAAKVTAKANAETAPAAFSTASLSQQLHESLSAGHLTSLQLVVHQMHSVKMLASDIVSHGFAATELYRPP